MAYFLTVYLIRYLSKLFFISFVILVLIKNIVLCNKVKFRIKGLSSADPLARSGLPNWTHIKLVPFASAAPWGLEKMNSTYS